MLKRDLELGCYWSVLKDSYDGVLLSTLLYGLCPASNILKEHTVSGTLYIFQSCGGKAG
jgi:hypothetical protein